MGSLLRRLLSRTKLFFKLKRKTRTDSLIQKHPAGLSEESSQNSKKFNLEEILKIPGYSRVKFNPDNTLTVKYLATDPEDKHTELINFEKQNTQSQIKKLDNVKHHTVSLFHAIRDFDINNDFKKIHKSDYTWESVCNHLHMASSITDVYADTSAADDSQSISYCRPAWEFEEARSETVSKYMAAQIFFNFIWMAYECAIEIAGDTRDIRKKTGAKGRVILSDSTFHSYQFPYFRDIYMLCLSSCYRDASIRNSSDFKNLLKSLDKSLIEQAAELVRIIRNRFMHGDEDVPYPEDHGGDPENDPINPIQRLYHTSRLILILIQILSLICIKNPLSPRISPYDDEADEKKGKYCSTIDYQLRSLHLFINENATRDLSLF